MSFFDLFLCPSLPLFVRFYRFSLFFCRCAFCFYLRMDRTSTPALFQEILEPPSMRSLGFDVSDDDEDGRDDGDIDYWIIRPSPRQEAVVSPSSPLCNDTGWFDRFLETLDDAKDSNAAQKTETVPPSQQEECPDARRPSPRPLSGLTHDRLRGNRKRAGCGDDEEGDDGNDGSTGCSREVKRRLKGFLLQRAQKRRRGTVIATTRLKKKKKAKIDRDTAIDY